MMFLVSQYSRFWSTRPMAFIVMNGLYLTYVTAILNLCSMGNLRFNTFYMWPLLYLAIIYADFTRLLTDEQVKLAYAAFTGGMLVFYLNFMGSVIGQLTR